MPDEKQPAIKSQPAAKPAPVPRVLVAARPADAQPSDRKDGKDELLVQYLDKAGMVREQFSGVVAERKNGDPYAETPEAVEWALPPLPGPRPRPGFTLRVMVMNHPAKWRAAVTETRKDGFTLKGEPEVTP